jgi:iron complex outermembrane receptor protein
MPSFTDLYYKGPQNRGNPYLKPEQALTVESGFKLSNKGVKGNLSYFHRWGTNIIDWIKYPNPDSIWFTTNYTKLNTNGIEFSLTIKPRDIIASAFFVDEVNLSYSFTSISKKKTEFDSYYALDNLKNKVVVCLIHSIWKKLGAMWCLTWQDRNGIFNKYDPDTKTSVETPYKPFFLFDGKIYWKTRIIKLFLEATNVFNVNYFDIGNIAQPGRWFKGGIEVNVGWK